MVDDWNVIEASILKQYGVRLRYELDTMTQDEFFMLISGLMPDTPLGNLVAIRSETDKEKIKQFTPEQKKIYNEWHYSHQPQVSHSDYKQDMIAFKSLFKSMAK